MAIRRFIDQVNGHMVVGAGGHIFGSITDVEVGSKMETTGIVVRLTASNIQKLGLKKPFWGRATLVVPIVHVKAVDEVVILDIDIDQFAKEVETAKPEESTLTRTATSVPKAHETDFKMGTHSASQNVVQPPPKTIARTDAATETKPPI